MDYRLSVGCQMDVLGGGPQTVVSIAPEANLTSLIQDIYSRARRGSRPPADYFFLTELVNPTQSLWRRLAPHVPRSQVLANRLELGRQRHRIAGYWFSRLPDFQLAEGTLDGFYVGIPEVVGRFDFLIGGRILEFKTKPVPDVSLADVTTRYLNDLEQLAFYAALSVDEPRDNTLCFLGDGSPYNANLRAFKVRVTDHARIRSEIQSRIQLLRDRVASGDATGMPRCSYFDEMCEFKEATCSCATGHHRPVGSITQWLEIAEDPETAQRLASTRTTADSIPNIWSIRDLMLPRQRYHGHWEYEQAPDFEPYVSKPEKDAAVALLASSVKQSDLVVPATERDRLYESGDSEVVCSRNFVRVHVPGQGQQPIPVPYIVRGSSATVVGSQPSAYHTTELALICARAGKPAGVVAVAYYELRDAPVVVFLVKFDTGRLRSFYDATKAQLTQAISSGSAEPLPACPRGFIAGCPFGGCRCRQELM